MSIPYTPGLADAAQDAFAGQAFADPGSSAYAAADPARVDAKYFLKPVQDEILSLHAGRVASASYRRTWTCVSGLNVGDPVYVSANDTVALADATTAAKAQVIGFVRYKPTTTTCYIEHFRYVSGLSGGTAGAAVCLSDAGGFSASAGTVAKIVGQWITATEALLHATQSSALVSAISGGSASFVPKFASASTLALSAYADNGTDGLFAKIGSTALTANDIVCKWRNGTEPGAYAATSGAGAGVYFRGQDAQSGSGQPGGSFYFRPGARGTTGNRAEVYIMDSDGGSQSLSFKCTGGSSGTISYNGANIPIVFSINTTNSFAVTPAFSGSITASEQGPWGFWTKKAFYLSPNSTAQSLGLGAHSTTAFQFFTSATQSDSTTCLLLGSNTAPAAYLAAADTDGKDAIFRTQSGGAHASNNPDGGDFAIHLGSKGSGGSGSNGEFLVYSPANSLNVLGCRSDRINRQDFWQYVTPSSGFTSDATPATIASLTLADAHVYHIRVRVLGVRTDGTVRESYEFLLTAYRTGAGSASILDTTTVHAPAAPTWTVACAASGNDIDVNVTGTAHGINWFSEIGYAQLGE